MKSPSSVVFSRRHTARCANLLSPNLTWHHRDRSYRVSIGPEVIFEEETGSGRWRPFIPDFRSDALRAGAEMVDRCPLQPYLEFCPLDWHSLSIIERFCVHRLLALTVLAWCPALRKDIREWPVLALVAAAHPALRDAAPQWEELNAVRERGSVHSVLNWVGMPPTNGAFRQLVSIDLDLPVSDLSRMRDILWQQHEANMSGQVDLTNALAA